MCDDPQFTQLIWERTKKYLPNSYVGNKFQYELKEMNIRWRYCKYTKGNYFGKHIDGGYQKSMKEMSFFTFMLYLNSSTDDYQGGSTNFYDAKGNVAFEVKGEPGMAV